MAEGDKHSKKNEDPDNSGGRKDQSRSERKFKGVRPYRGRGRGSDNRKMNRPSNSRFSSSRTSTPNGKPQRQHFRNEKDRSPSHSRPRRSRISSKRRNDDGHEVHQQHVQPLKSSAEPRAAPKRNRDIPKTPEEIVERMGRTKKRILIELYKDSVGYKKLSKILGVGLDTIRSHIKSGKYSTSLQEIGLVERSENGGWQLTALGLQVCELLQQDPELRAYFY